MPTVLWRAMIGAGKTEAALQHIDATLRAAPQPFPQVWVLLANQRQEYAFRERLALRAPSPHALFNVETFDFYQLYARLLRLSGTPSRQLQPSARQTLLRGLLRAQAARLRYYDKIAHTLGFAQQLADFFDELKQSLIDDDDFAAQASTSKDHDLALLYSAYQSLLKQHDLTDREGQGWLALARLDEAEALGQVVLLMVDGFDQFSPLQARLLARLSCRLGQVVVTLSSLADRLAYATRFQQAEDALRQAHEQEGAAFSVEALPAQARRSPALQALVENIFRRDAASLPHDEAALRLLSAPDPAQELGLVLRDLKRRLLDGLPPDQAMIVVRDWPTYQAHLEAARRAYDLPLLLHQPDSLDHAPILAILRLALSLHQDDFPRQALLEVMASPYVGVAPRLVAALDRLSRERLVRQGRDAWLRLAQEADQRPEDQEVDDDERAADWLYLSSEDAADLANALHDLFTALTPPLQASLSEYVAWLDHLIGQDPLAEDEDDSLAPPLGGRSLDVVRRLRELARAASDPEEQALFNREMTALHGLKRALSGFLQGQALLGLVGLSKDATLSWDDFQRELWVAVEQSNVTTRRQTAREGRVLVTTANNARGLPQRVVYVLGLSEGLFPSPAPQDPIYLDSERAAFAQAGLPLRLAAERADDSSLFYELLCLAQDVLVLTRPTVKDGKAWDASALWQEVLRCYKAPRVHDLPPGAVVPYAQALTLSEALLAAADGLSADPPRHDGSAWASAQPAWKRITQGRRIEAARQDARQPHDAFNGDLSGLDSPLVKSLRQAVVDNLWSASQLNSLGKCGYYWFAERALKLRAWEEPEEGLNALQRGNLLHALLYRLYEWARERGYAVQPSNAEAVLSQLDAEGRAWLDDAAARQHFIPSPTWDEEAALLLRQVRALVALDFSEDSKRPLAPYGVRRIWGLERRIVAQVDLAQQARVNILGYIDRIDQTDAGLIVIDYKSGSLPSLSDMTKGRNFQLLVYKLALEAQQRRPVIGGLYWSLSDPEEHKKGRFGEALLRARTNRSKDEDDPLPANQAWAAVHVQRAQRADFRVQASNQKDGKCDAYCPYHQLCRLASTSPYKPARAETDA
ncbi:MAG: exodeoxyribonuclease V subunit gamma [Anaerolineae bacterium]|nr:exodeoxyribonuclease V subunit gamma [Anaerolineae bacterium]MDW8172216.1 PD-(D/E)XK nuclease family protein [Anaerolineae bacterium]